MKKNDPNNSSSRTLIDDNLRRVYEELANDELPDRFQDLLNQLKDKDADKGSKD